MPWAWYIPAVLKDINPHTKFQAATIIRTLKPTLQTWSKSEVSGPWHMIIMPLFLHIPLTAINICCCCCWCVLYFHGNKLWSCRDGQLRGGTKKFWASGIFPIQIVQCFTPNVQKCVRYWLHLGSYCWLSLFSHNTWSKIHTPTELAKWTKLSTERW